MKCYIHTTREAVASCVRCGNLMCEECRVLIDGKNVCKGCITTSDNQNQTDWVKNAYESNNQPSGGININLSTISKVLLYVAIIFSAIEIFNRVIGFANNLLSSILYLNFGIGDIVFHFCNLMLLGTFAILLLVNLSKITNIKFINNENIGSLTAIAVALLVLECLIYSVFNVYAGFFSMLIANLTDMSIAIPIIATVVNIFVIYKHKLNIHINN